MKMIHDKPKGNGDENTENVSMLEREESGTILFFHSDNDSDKDDDIDFVSNHTTNDIIPGESESPASAIQKHGMNKFQDKAPKNIFTR